MGICKQGQVKILILGGEDVKKLGGKCVDSPLWSLK